MHVADAGCQCKTQGCLFQKTDSIFRVITSEFMASLSTKILFLTVGLAVVISSVTGAFGNNPERVLLRDVKAITLQQGRMTSGRRSSPVSQLQCVGGTAKGSYTPSTVQCINGGSDGYDIQWECKTDMDNSYKFGTVEVTCEGYDYPDDPYILKGSCGLEYTLDFTEEGHRKHRQQSHSYSQQHSSFSSQYSPEFGKKASSVFGDLLFLGGIALVIYIIYKTCLSSNRTASRDDSNYPGADMGGNRPPPYGFRPEYMPGDESCSSTRSPPQSNTYTDTGANTGGGFWTGAATGGFLGYLFGRNNGYNTYTQHQPHNSWGWGQQYRSRPFFGGGWGSGWGSGGSVGGSVGGGSFGGSGSRTASGFGGTKRR